MNRKILVTGATGNVGREVVRLFYDEGYYIKAAVRNLQNIDKYFGLSSIVEQLYALVFRYTFVMRSLEAQQFHCILLLSHAECYSSGDFKNCFSQ